MSEVSEAGFVSSKVVRVPIALVPLVRAAIARYKDGERLAEIQRITSQSQALLQNLDQ